MTRLKPTLNEELEDTKGR